MASNGSSRRAGGRGIITGPQNTIASRAGAAAEGRRLVSATGTVGVQPIVPSTLGRVPDVAGGWRDDVAGHSLPGSSSICLHISARSEDDAARTLVAALVAHYRHGDARQASDIPSGAEVIRFDFENLAQGRRVWNMYVFFFLTL